MKKIISLVALVLTICSTMQAQELTIDSPVGTIGMLKDREAIVVDLGGTIGKVAIATKNVGADLGGERDPNGYGMDEGTGDFFAYDDVFTSQNNGITDGWYLPSKEELTALWEHLTPKSTKNGMEWNVTDKATLSLPVHSSAYVIGTYPSSERVSPGKNGCVMVFIFDENGELYHESGMYDVDEESNVFYCGIRLFHELPTEIMWYTTVSGKKINPDLGVEYTTEYDAEKEMYAIKTKVPFSDIPEKACAETSDLSSLIISDRVKTIGRYAFAINGNLTSVEIGSGVKTIKEYAFFLTPNLVNINFLDGELTTIGDSAFNYCPFDPKKNLTLPSKLEYVGKDAFASCRSHVIIFSSIPYLEEGGGFSADLNCVFFLDDNSYISFKQSIFPHIVYGSSRYITNVEPGKWVTRVLPFPGGWTNCHPEVYVLKEASTENGGVLIFENTGNLNVEAGVPYLIYSSSDNTLRSGVQSINVEDVKPQTAGSFTMNGSYTKVSLNTPDAPNPNLYYLKDNQFYHANGKINIAPFRAYIESNVASQAKYFAVVIKKNDDVTAVPGVMDENGNIDETIAIYDLSGKKLDTPQRGIVNVIRTKSGKTIKRMF